MSEKRTAKDWEEIVERCFEEARSRGLISPERETARRGVSRRDLLQWGALAGAGASAAAGMLGARPARADAGDGGPADGAALGGGGDPGPTDINDMTIAQMQSAMAKGKLSATEATELYIARIRNIDRGGPFVNSILQLNPDAIKIALALDKERKTKGPRGPLHGIPVTLKDNYDTADKMQTTAGSFALVGQPPAKDSTVAARLRAAGAVILGKTNLSEFANFRSFHSSSGWSGRGGQTNNPYVLNRNPCGSSSGSGAAVTANLCAAGMGTETDGSIVCPANNNGVVGIKPTLGLTSRAGVVPIAHSQDVTGPHARTVADAAAVLSALVGVDPRDAATAASAGKFSTDYTKFLDPNGLKGARIGVARAVYTGYSEKTDAIYEEAIAAMQSAGAIIIDPADIPTAATLNTDPSEFNVLLWEFKRDLNAYLATRSGLPVQRLIHIIAFNQAAAAAEMPFFQQEILELAQSDPVTRADYVASLARGRSLAGEQGIDAVFAQFNLDALIAPTGAPAWTTDLVDGDHFQGASSTPAAVAGYPNISVNMGYSFTLPVGLSFMGPAYTEGKLIKIAYAFEQTVKNRRPPKFLPTNPDAHGNFAKSAAVDAAALFERITSDAAAGVPSFRLHSL